MKIFLDSGDIREIHEAHSLGLIDGVVINPSLVTNSGNIPRKILEEILSCIDAPISIQLTEKKYEALLNEGRELAKLCKNIVLKLPPTPEGLKAIKILSSEDIKTNVTLCFSVSQAILAAKAGATYVSAFVGRLDDISNNGSSLIEDIRIIYDNYGFDTQIITASVRSPIHFISAAKCGSDVIATPFAVLMQLLKHPLTESGLQS